MNILVFLLDQFHFALDLSKVERVIRAVEYFSLPEGSPYYLGAINMHGEILPVMNLRKIFHLKEKELDIDDQFIICYAKERKMALWVDTTTKVLCVPKEKSLSKEHLMIDQKYVHSIFKDNGDTILICDVEQT
jgi:purine-binding chemotaxis protein CheW